MNNQQQQQENQKRLHPSCGLTTNYYVNRLLGDVNLLNFDALNEFYQQGRKIYFENLDLSAKRQNEVMHNNEPTRQLCDNTSCAACVHFLPIAIGDLKTGLRIAFTGKAGAGKTTASNYVLDMFSSSSSKRVSFAAPLYNILENIQSTFGFPISKQREPLQWVGEWARKFSTSNNYKDPILKIAEEEIRGDDTIYSLRGEYKRCIVVDDLRMKVEYDLLKKLNFFIFRIVGRQHTSENMSGGSKTHKTEVDLDDVAIDTIDNSELTIDEFHAALKLKIMRCVAINYLRQKHCCEADCQVFLSIMLEKYI